MNAFATPSLAACILVLVVTVSAIVRGWINADHTDRRVGSAHAAHHGCPVHDEGVGNS